MNKNEQEGQSAGRTTGASSNQAEQQNKRSIEGQESQPGKVWQESDQGQYSGEGQQAQGGKSSGQTGQAQGQSGQSGQYSGQSGQSGQGGQYSGQGGDTSQSGQYTGQGDTRVGGSDPRGGDQDRSDEVNEQMDESQWQGNRFGQGGTGNTNG